MTLMTDLQRRAIFAQIRELGWDDDMRRGMLDRWIGKPSLSHTADRPITSAEATEVLRRLAAEVRSAQARRRARHKRSRRNHPSSVPTPEQLHKIDGLRSAIFGEDLGKFRSLCRRIVKVDDPKWFTARQAVMITQTLLRMQEAGWSPNTPRRSDSANDNSAPRANYPHTSVE